MRSHRIARDLSVPAQPESKSLNAKCPNECPFRLSRQEPQRGTKNRSGKRELGIGKEIP